MKQMTFADAEYAVKHKRTRKELFLMEMDEVVPWKDLIALIEPHYPRGSSGLSFDGDLGTRRASVIRKCTGPGKVTSITSV